ncbi:hypothetical protein [Sulfurovum mangrovi]|uniref:hypothetical protein n=1 Tax=Sulfurovum mangrovi TaxID=2893889 RepID=UPI001E57A827|nr:hypothetical protein [Sulfurovum mangrovi]UFH60473.1 hypothetical protein LN246_06345 [Sulfurovum mangrovi]
MYSLKKPKLGTDPKKGWPFYAMQMTSSFIIKDFFLISNYRKCIRHSSNYYDIQNNLIHLMENKTGEVVPQKDMILANAKELSNWTKKMESEGFHELYLHSFIGIWSSFEAGLENCFSDFIENDRTSAEVILTKFKKTPYSIEEWPWTKSICFELASKLELKAKQLTENTGIDYFLRLKTIFAWFGVQIDIEEIHINNLAEANRVRNIILHRNGEIDSKDASDFPSLSEWEGEVMPFTEKIFKNYYDAIIKTLFAINKGTIEKVKREKLIDGFADGK